MSESDYMPKGGVRPSVPGRDFGWEYGFSREYDDAERIQRMLARNAEKAVERDDLKDEGEDDD
ncbi:MAG TPA: hypothetical protein VGE13_02085 [Candidatus Saccharimonadales bacterium]